MLIRRSPTDTLYGLMSLAIAVVCVTGSRARLQAAEGQAVRGGTAIGSANAARLCCLCPHNRVTENLRRFDMKRGGKAREGGDCE